MTIIKIGTRGSDLAVTQSQWVADQIEAAHDEVKVELVIIKTRGDRDQKSALNKFAGKGIFTKEIEDALLAGEVDLAVHSLKDLPTTLPEGLALAQPPKREDPRDLLVSSVPLMELPEGAVVGTGSARRREQLRMLRPDLKFEEIRGNVATRVRKWRDGLYDATVLACAGVDTRKPDWAPENPDRWSSSSVCPRPARAFSDSKSGRVTATPSSCWTASPVPMRYFRARPNEPFWPNSTAAATFPREPMPRNKATLC